MVIIFLPFFSNGKPFNITVIQVYAPSRNAEEAERFYEDLQDLIELAPQKDILFIIGDWNTKVGSCSLSSLKYEFSPRRKQIHLF